MTLEQIYKQIKKGTIKIDAKGHKLNHLLDEFEWKIKHFRDQIKKLKNAAEDKDKMLDYYTRMLHLEIEVGRPVTDVDIRCHLCDGRLYLLLMPDDSFAVMNSTEYWAAAEQYAKKVGDKNAKFGYHIPCEEIPRCMAEPLEIARKLVSRINVPSGEMIFVNFFNQEHIYDFPKDSPLDYNEKSINAIIGRNNLMQYLATQNVGYGQMGNMSVDVWTNDKDEILVADPYMEDRVGNRGGEIEYMRKHPKDYTEEDIQKEIRQAEYTEKVMADLETRGFKNKGSISLSVWRWMCADKKVLEGHGEKLEDLDDDVVEVTVKPGTWEIEHYFDFSRIGNFGEDFEDPIFSRLKLIADEK